MLTKAILTASLAVLLTGCSVAGTVVDVQGETTLPDDVSSRDMIAAVSPATNRTVRGVLTSNLINKGYLVIPSYAMQAMRRRITSENFLIFQCDDIGIKQLAPRPTGYAQKVQCTGTRASNGEVVFSGVAGYAGTTIREDYEGAARHALSTLPRAKGPGRLASLAELQAIADGTKRAPGGRSDDDSVKGTGTGFFVSASGHMITNSHVVDGCNSITVNLGSQKLPAQMLANDQATDLALIKIDHTSPGTARIRSVKALQEGERILVAGYPRTSVLGVKINITTGVVSALSGIRNDFRQIQITAPIQPGNSGGPVLDKNGNVIAVAVARLKSRVLSNNTIDVSQNVNFAIKSDFVNAMTTINGIEIMSAKVSKDGLSNPEIATIAKTFTRQVLCN